MGKYGTIDTLVGYKACKETSGFHRPASILNYSFAVYFVFSCRAFILFLVSIFYQKAKIVWNLFQAAEGSLEGGLALRKTCQRNAFPK